MKLLRASFVFSASLRFLVAVFYNGTAATQRTQRKRRDFLRRRESRVERIFYSVVLFLLLILGRSISAQVPTPTPTPTGRSYDTSNLPKTPPVPGPQAKSPVLFSNITSTSKIDFKHAGSPTSKKFLLETMGGGVAIFDFNNDGRMDLFFTNGAALREDMSNDTP